MKIKTLTSDDWKMLRDIRLAGLKSDPQAFGGSFDEEVHRQELDWRKRLKNPDRIFMAVEENHSLLSLAGAIKNSADEWSLVAVHTLSHARGKGYAQVLVKHVIEEVKKRGAQAIQLMVNTDQTDALHVYEKAGFKIVETIKGEKMGDGLLHDEYLMKIDLTQLNKF
jgi:ribosomal protein S18 acetylase RimI-like enzyme